MSNFNFLPGIYYILASLVIDYINVVVSISILFFLLLFFWWEYSNSPLLVVAEWTDEENELWDDEDMDDEIPPPVVAEVMLDCDAISLISSFSCLFKLTCANIF